MDITRRDLIVGSICSGIGAALLGGNEIYRTLKSRSGAPSATRAPAMEQLPLGKFAIDQIDIDGGTDTISGTERPTFLILKMRSYDPNKPDDMGGRTYEGVIRARDMDEAKTVLGDHMQGRVIEILSLPPNSAYRTAGGFRYELDTRGVEVDNMTTAFYRRTMPLSPERRPGEL